MFITGWFGYGYFAIKRYRQNSNLSFMLQHWASNLFFIFIGLTVCIQPLKTLWFVCAIGSGWLYLMSLLLGNEMTGMFVIFMYRAIVNDVLRFIIFYISLLGGFAAAMYVCAPNIAYWEWVIDLGLLLIQQRNFSEFKVAEEQAEIKILLVVYLLSCAIIGLNMLIAMMNETYADVKANAKKAWQLAHAQIILSIENEIGQHRLNNNPAFQYWIEGNGRSLQVEDTNQKA